jgi:hypothetical protein
MITTPSAAPPLRLAAASLLFLAACTSANHESTGTTRAPLDLAPLCDASDPTKACSPRFDEIFQKSAHNSYWVNNDKTPDDLYAAGTQMRVWDQLLHEHVRSLEWDLHRDLTWFPTGALSNPLSVPLAGSGHPGEFRVYHTSESDNSTCFTLADCLQLLQRLDYVLPQHEVVHIALELKQLEPLTHDVGLFDDSSWRPEELDRLLWEHLGPRLFTPAEFMQDCYPQETLRQCATHTEWPTVDQLRGRYIVTVHGTPNPVAPGAGNERAYWQYAAYDGSVVDIRTRAAFPMFVVEDNQTVTKNGVQVTEGVRDVDVPAFKAQEYGVSDPAFQTMWRNALDATIFFQLENWTNPDFLEVADDGVTPQIPLHRRFHGIVRSTAAHFVDLPIPAGLEDNVGKIAQRPAVASGFQMLMTDYPVNFASDVAPWNPSGLPSNVGHPFFEAADVGMATTRHFPLDALREPGQRIYFDTTNRNTNFDITDPAAENMTADPNKLGQARLVRPAPSASVEPFDDWEVFPATSMTGHSQGPLETTPFGTGCVDAGSADGADLIRVCRRPNADDQRSVAVTVNIIQGGTQTDYNETLVHPNVIQGQPFGDALRLFVARGGASTTVTVLTAAEMTPGGSPRWSPYSAGPWTFGQDLPIQGLVQIGDGLFAGTRLNGAPIHFSDFTPDATFPSYSLDVSFCTDGSCRGVPLPSPETVVVGADEATYVGVHEVEGPVFNGQWRTLYTTNRFEVVAGGLHQYPAMNKFFLRRNRLDATWQPLYRCIDWSRDIHSYWLDVDPSCPNDSGLDARSSGVMGYLSTQPLAGAQPLYHLRKGTYNAITLGPNTYDHYFAVGDAQRQAKLGMGYSDVAPAGWTGPLPQPLGYVLGAVPPLRGRSLDVNGDGYADVVVGAPGKTTSDVGAAAVYLGGPGGFGANPSPASTLQGAYGPGGGFGFSVANAGDVNHDGYSDVIVGEPDIDGVDEHATQGDGLGRAYLFFGGPGGLGASPQPATTLVGPDGPWTLFGTVVAGVGDVDGDGYADVAVSAPAYATATGRVYLYRGGPQGPATTPTLVLTGFDVTYGGVPQQGLFGRALAPAGDVNGDGFADVVIGSQSSAYGYGRAYVYYGSASGLGGTPGVTLDSPQGNLNFGTSVAGAGDVNGDGFGDVLVAGTYGFAEYLGSAAGIPATPTTYITTFPDPSLIEFATVAGIGDVNGDGFADVGAGALTTGFTGPILVYYGGPSGIGASSAMGLQGGGYSAWMFAGAGDSNGDGYADLLVGSVSDTQGVGGGLYYPGGPQGLATTPATTMTSQTLQWLGAAVAGWEP